MTLRLVTPIADPLPEVRPSARVATVAKMLDQDPGSVRRMIRDGQLEAHRVGKCGIRVFLDSVADWQQSNRVKPVKAIGAIHLDAPKPPSRATQAAHRQAVAHLQALGLVRRSRL